MKLLFTGIFLIPFTLSFSVLIICADPHKPLPHPVPKLKDLYKPWIFARASEASTLFIEPHFKGKVPYAHIIQTKNKLYWFEFDGIHSSLWKVHKYSEQEKQLTLYLEDGGEVLILPYWDIDHCLLIIRKIPTKEENPTHFAVPYQHLQSIPFIKGE